METLHRLIPSLPQAQDLTGLPCFSPTRKNVKPQRMEKSSSKLQCGPLGAFSDPKELSLWEVWECWQQAEARKEYLRKS